MAVHTFGNAPICVICAGVDKALAEQEACCILVINEHKLILCLFMPFQLLLHPDMALKA